MNQGQTNIAKCLRETAGVPFKNDYEFIMMFFMIRKDIYNIEYVNDFHAFIYTVKILYV